MQKAAEPFNKWEGHGALGQQEGGKKHRGPFAVSFPILFRADSQRPARWEVHTLHVPYL